MATKPKKVKPYDPYQPYGNHSLPWFQQQANLRATNDTNAQVAALPSSAFYTTSAQQLAQALGGIQGQQNQVAASASPLYAQAFDSASSAANKAAMVGGGTGVTATPGGGSLVGALGATMAQALSGGQSAAVERGRNDVIARAGQESAIRAKQPSAAAAYLKEMTDNALQARAAATNEMLARSQFNLQSSDTNFDNNLNAARFNADVAASGQDAASKADRDRQKLRDKKLAGVQARIDKWIAPVKRQNGGVYTFQPNLVDANGKRLPAFEITAKDGSSAVNAAIAKMTSMGIQHISGTQMGSWLKSTKPTYGDVPQKSKRDAYNIAVKQLTSSGLFTKREAQRMMRDYFGVSQTGPLKL